MLIGKHRIYAVFITYPSDRSIQGKAKLSPEIGILL